MIISTKYKFIFITGEYLGTFKQDFLLKHHSKQELFTPTLNNLRLLELFKPEVLNERWLKQNDKHLNRNIKLSVRRLCKTHTKITAQDLKSVLRPEVWNSYYKFSVVKDPWERYVSSFLTNRKTNETFNDFLNNENKICKLQTSHIVDEQGNNLVDKVIMLENYAQDMKEVVDALQCDETMFSYIGSKRVDKYKEYYTTYEQVEKVRRNHIFEIDKFNYVF